MKNRSTARDDLLMALPALKAKMLQECEYESVYVVQNGKFRFVNPNFAAMGKYEEQEMLGMETLRLVHPDDRLTARENAIKMLKGERPTPYQFRIIAKDGSVKWIQETVHAISYKGKRAVLGNSMDLTAQREAAEKLKELQALQSSILDALPIAVMGMQERRIVFANHAVEEVFGWKPEELVGQSTRVLYLSDEVDEEVGRNLYQALQNDRTYRAEFPCRRRDGKPIFCLVSVSIIGESLRDKRIIATYNDITERKRAEEALSASEKKLTELLRKYQEKERSD